MRRKHEVELMKKVRCHYLLASGCTDEPSNGKDLAARGLPLILDGIPRISAQGMDALTSMVLAAGQAVLMAANRLPKFMPMVGTAVGMIKPSNVLVIGTGIAGLQAVATAKRLGAVVYAADIRPDAREQAKSLGAKIVDVGVPAEVAVGTGGYAKKLPDSGCSKREATGHSIEADIIVHSADPGQTCTRVGYRRDGEGYETGFRHC